MRSRELGAELRAVRERAGYTRRELAVVLGWSESKVSRMESGQRGASEVNVATYLAYCKVVGDELDRLIAFCREVWATDWLRPLDELRTLVYHETTATLIHEYDPLVIPGLLQTEDYSREMFRSLGLVPDDVIEARVRARMERQNLLRRERGVEVNFFIPERILRSVVGSPRVMNDQLLHLVLITGRPWCSVRVLPESFMPGALGGAFRLMEYADHPPVAYVENQTHALFLEDRADIKLYRGILAKLKRVTLDRGQSRDLLAHLANEYDVPEGPR